jgi:transcriptional regulator with XRE-family HTH domain
VGAETIGEVIARLRRARGWSQGRLAELLNDSSGRPTLDRSEISRYERGLRTPRWWLPHLARVLEVDLSMLERAARGVPSGVDLERLDYVADQPRKVDQAAVEALAASLAHLRRLDDSAGSHAVLPPVTATVRLVESMVREARGKIRPRMLDVGAQWLQFVGWLNTTTNQHDIARAQHDRMLEWAVELGDPSQIATALGVKGHRAWTLDEYGPMVGLSEAAGRDRHAAPAVLAVAAQQQARGHALLGEADDAERMLDRAVDHSVRAVEDRERIPPWLYFHSTDLLELQRGLAYKFLAEAGRVEYRRKAIDAITTGLDGLDEETRSSEWISWYDQQLAELHDAPKRAPGHP